MRRCWEMTHEFFEKYYGVSSRLISDNFPGVELYDEISSIGEGAVCDQAYEFLEYLRNHGTGE